MVYGLAVLRICIFPKLSETGSRILTKGLRWGNVYKPYKSCLFRKNWGGYINLAILVYTTLGDKFLNVVVIGSEISI